jgi:hypothetical protein
VCLNPDPPGNQFEFNNISTESSNLIQALNESLEVSLPASLNREELEALLAEMINDLILRDFSRLIQILYRVDVSEQKLKDLLKQYPNTTAGSIIAPLIIERQEKKIESRNSFGKHQRGSNEERW